MLFVVGLGNPGNEYKDHRHNVGFQAIDAIARHATAPALRRDGNVLKAKTRLHDCDLMLIKPQSFVNLSGQAVLRLLQYYKITPRQLLVIHDEMALGLGKVRLKHAGGHAGHNGIRNIIDHIGGDFTRLRIGIDHPGAKHRVHHYVLSPFDAAEQAIITPIIDAVASHIHLLALGQFAQFQNRIAAHSTDPDDAR